MHVKNNYFYLFKAVHISNKNKTNAVISNQIWNTFKTYLWKLVVQGVSFIRDGGPPTFSNIVDPWWSYTPFG
jgi:hypothetical protein